MILQHLLMPRAGICNQQNMYVRVDEKNARFVNEHQALSFCKGGTARFDTYFNGFSIEKWQKYTQVQNVFVTLQLKGKFEIQLCSKEKIHDTISEKELSITTFESSETTSITLPFHSYDNKGMFYVRLNALEDGAEYHGGFYSAEIAPEKLQNVEIAIDICTFRREKFIIRNLDILSQYVLDNKDNELSKHLQVFISDNGKTLDIPTLSNDKIHIVENKNVGGAGGFTRGLMEILHCSTYRATHALIMDDDILIDPEALYRTYAFLRCRKPEYDDLFVGGAMLRLDQPNIQVESGAVWNAGNLESKKAGLDLNKVKNCLYNELEEYCEYNAWWYCCVPMSVVNENNLPMPIFIRGDDLEYGLRNIKHMALLNGICVWHEPFENKYSSFLSYYILRNMLYDNALHFKHYSKKRLISRMCNMVFHELMYYRYKNVDLIFRGVNDFLKGVEFLENTDGEKLHQEIMAAGYRGQDLSQLDMPFSYPTYAASLTEVDGGIKKKLRCIGFNGLLRSTNRDNIVSMALCRPINFYRAKRVMQYDVTSQKAFITEKDTKKTLRYLWLLFKEACKINREFDEAFHKFGEEAGRLQTEEFWRCYLEIKK